MERGLIPGGTSGFQTCFPGHSKDTDRASTRESKPFGRPLTTMGTGIRMRRYSGSLPFTKAAPAALQSRQGLHSSPACQRVPSSLLIESASARALAHARRCSPKHSRSRLTTTRRDHRSIPFGERLSRDIICVTVLDAVGAPRGSGGKPQRLQFRKKGAVASNVSSVPLVLMFGLLVTAAFADKNVATSKAAGSIWQELRPAGQIERIYSPDSHTPGVITSPSVHRSGPEMGRRGLANPT